jgi:4-amino-4-deoxy-L-arabinose transferase-like glycosyltransferase
VWKLGTLIAITLIGLALRLYRLDALGFSGNEDYLVIAVRGVLDRLLPVFPSGIFYPRALPLTYIAAAVVKLLGFSEYTLRLPSVLFSTGSIPLVYYLGRRFLRPATALLAALLLAVSDWDVAVAQTARMYSIFSFFLLLSLALFCKTALGGGRWIKLLTCLSILLACSLHQIGIALCPIFVCFALYLFRRGSKPHFALLCAALAFLGYIGDSRFEKWHYRQWDALVQERTAEAGAVELQAALDGPARVVHERVLPLFHHLRGEHPYLFMALGALLGAVALYCIVLAFRRPDARLFSMGLLAVAAVLYLQQAMLAHCFLLVYLFVGRALEPSRYGVRTLVLLAAMAGGSIFWGCYALGTAPSSLPLAENAGLLETVRVTLRTLLYYPPNFGRIFLATYPWMILFALIPMLLATGRYMRDLEIDETALFSLLFILPNLMLGLHPAALTAFLQRYVHFLVPIFLLLAAHGMTWTGANLSRIAKERRVRAGLRRAGVVIFILIVAFATQIGGALRSWSVVTSGYGSNEALYDNWLNVHPFNPDHKGASLFVMGAYRAGDLVVAMDILAHYAYFPRADYALTLSPKRDAEGWIGAATLGSASALEEVLAANPGRRAWVVLAGPQLMAYSTHPEMEAILNFLRERGGEPAYRGRDGLSDVYLLQAESRIGAAGAAAGPLLGPEEEAAGRGLRRIQRDPRLGNARS